MYASRIDAKRHSFPQNYKILIIHPNRSMGNFSYAGLNIVFYRFIAVETASRSAVEFF